MRAGPYRRANETKNSPPVCLVLSWMDMQPAYRCGLLPRVFGVLLMAGCFGYLANLFGVILVPDYTELSIRTILSLPALIGEIGIGLWLLLVGARPRREQPQPAR
jgi:hypothetical protein